MNCSDGGGLRGQVLHRRQGRKARDPSCGPWPLLQPGDNPIDIDRGGGGHVLQVGLLYAPIASPTEAEGPHALRQRPFDPRATLIALPPVLTRIPGPGRLQRFKVLLRREMETAPSLCSPGAERPRVARPAVLEAEAHERIRFALPIDILPPDGCDRSIPNSTVG